VTTWAVVPVKSASEAKHRLASVLTSDERNRLMLAMLNDVVGHLGQAHGIAGVSLVSPEPAVCRPGVRWIRDPGGGLNAAVTHAVRVLQGEGVTATLIIPADIPLATPAEIDLVLAAGREAQVVLVPNRNETGTNALLLSPPALMPPAFGRHSFARHLARAEGLGIKPLALRLPGLGFDVDSPEDLDLLRQRVSGRHETYGVLQSCDGGGR